MNNIITPDLSSYSAQVIEENGRFALTYWPYCTKCKSPFQFDADEPFAHCSCGTTEWGDPRPASWVRPELRLGEQYAGLVLKDGTPSPAYLEAAREVQTWIKERAAKGEPS